MPHCWSHAGWSVPGTLSSRQFAWMSNHRVARGTWRESWLRPHTSHSGASDGARGIFWGGGWGVATTPPGPSTTETLYPASAGWFGSTPVAPGACSAKVLWEDIRSEPPRCLLGSLPAPALLCRSLRHHLVGGRPLDDGRHPRHPALDEIARHPVLERRRLARVPEGPGPRVRQAPQEDDLRHAALEPGGFDMPAAEARTGTTHSQPA